MITILLTLHFTQETQAIQREHSCIFPPFFKVSLFLHQFSVVKGMSILQCATVQPSTCAFDSMVSHYPNSALPAASLYHLYLKSHRLFSSLCLNLLHTHFCLRLYSINTRADFKLPKLTTHGSHSPMAYLFHDPFCDTQILNRCKG